MKKLYYLLMLFGSIAFNVEAIDFGPYGHVANDLWDIAKTASPDTNGVYTLSVGCGKNTGSKDTVIAGMLTIVNTNGIGVDLVGGKLGKQWEYGGGAFSLGRFDAFPVIGKVRESAGDGVIYDWQSREPANYLFALVSKDWDFKHLNFGIGGLVDDRSNAKGVDIVVGVHFSVIPKNW